MRSLHCTASTFDFKQYTIHSLFLNIQTFEIWLQICPSLKLTNVSVLRATAVLGVLHREMEANVETNEPLAQNAEICQVLSTSRIGFTYRVIIATLYALPAALPVLRACMEQHPL